ncbi:hypothetical protein [Pedobacter sp. Leaf250]|uniref:hypothetical protein n=1 Tax=Pedobacter sp. Leaf250 TaxID=2876559 RepID=UPI001E4EC79D|nr:hypothetical protein [Pedobacter sp. Leaf250]
MMNISDEGLSIPNDYYRTQFVDSFRGGVDGDNTMTFIVKDDTELVAYANAAKLVWESVGDYPSSFKGIVRTKTGNSFATFEYVGALNESVTAVG